MDMIIVEVSVPAVSMKFDFKMPTTRKIKDITVEIVRMLEVTQSNLKFDSDIQLLCDLDQKKFLNPNATVAEMNIRDGSELMLL